MMNNNHNNKRYLIKTHYSKTFDFVSRQLTEEKWIRFIIVLITYDNYSVIDKYKMFVNNSLLIAIVWHLSLSKWGTMKNFPISKLVYDSYKINIFKENKYHLHDNSGKSKCCYYV